MEPRSLFHLGRFRRDANRSWLASFVAIWLPLCAVMTGLLIGCQRPDDSTLRPSTQLPASDSASHTGSPAEHTTRSSPTPTLAAVVPAHDATVDDPTRDGWDSEVFSQRAGSQLDKLFEAIVQPGVDLPEGCITSSATATPLRPQPLKLLVKASPFAVQRMAQLPEANGDASTDEIPLVRAVESLRQALVGISDVHRKIKMTRISIDDVRPGATFLLSLDGHASDRSVQITATIRSEWDAWEQGREPRLQRMLVEKYEEVTGPAASAFRECTPSLMANVPRYKDQFLFSCDHWAKRIEAALGTNHLGYHGVSIGDVDGDGLEDILLCQPGGTPNALLLQQPDGSLEDISASSGMDLLDSCKCGLFLDLDNDGDQDVVIASITGTLFYENDGRAKMTLRAKFAAAKQGYSLAAADYDGDGDVDVYACCYHPPGDAEFGNPVPYYDANNGPPNALLRNDGDWKFHNVTVESGLDTNNRRWSYAASWEDFDRDGDPDLYVANDFGRNCLYRNDDGKFTDVAKLAGVEDVASGMSASWGDYNHDGWMDLYVSNMFSSAGGRITYQRSFKNAATDVTRQSIQRLARGNSLFENRGDGTFRDVTYDAAVEMGRWAWSSNFVDINNDGWEDLYVANGHYTGEDSGDL